MNKKGLCRASLLCTGLRLSKNLYNEKGRPPYPYKSAKSRDLCVAFCTSQGRGAPLVRWPDGHTFFGPVSGRPYFLCFSAYNRPGAGAQYGSGGTPPAPCKNSKKWPKPLFRHAQKRRLSAVSFFILFWQRGPDGGLHSTGIPYPLQWPEPAAVHRAGPQNPMPYPSLRKYRKR